MFCKEKKEAKCTTFNKKKEDTEDVRPPKNCVLFFNGCNECKVAADDLLHCPRRMCQTEGDLSKRCTLFRNEVPEHCTLWFDGCNDCTIGDNKQLGCTKKACSKMTAPRCKKVDTKCTVWNDGCNDCNVVDGEIKECTERACFTQNEPKCKVMTGGVKPEKPNVKVPKGCTSMFDGCNI